MRRRSRFLAALAVLAALAAYGEEDHARGNAFVADSSLVADTSGTAFVQWAFDRWTAPWVQVSGAAHVLDPTSSATLMALECETAELERDRLTRHLSAAECEHRMAAIRAGQDTSLYFRLDLRVIEFPGAPGLARLGPTTSIWFEDDRGRQQYPVETLRGPVVDVIRGERLRRVYDYYAPPWVRDARSQHPFRYEPRGGRPVSVAEHRVRFDRRDRRSLDPVVTRSTRWLRLHLKSSSYEWVATWAFRPDVEVLEASPSSSGEAGGRP